MGVNVLKVFDEMFLESRVLFGSKKEGEGAGEGIEREIEMRIQ